MTHLGILLKISHVAVHPFGQPMLIHKFGMSFDRPERDHSAAHRPGLTYKTLYVISN